MLTSLALPTLALMALAFAVPRLGERWARESPAGLVALALVSALIVWLLAALGFAGLYLWQSPRVVALLGDRAGAGLRHFLVLGLKAGLIWAPVVVLTVSTAPRRWKTATW